MNKHPKILVLIIILLIHFTGFIYSQAEQYKFRHLTTKEGLSSNYVYCIIKDSTGFMWFGTGNGLNCFDGNKIVVYKHIRHDSTSLSNNVVLSILELDPDHLLVGTAWGGLNIFDKATEKFVHLKHQSGDHTSLSQDRINIIYRDNQGLIWIGTDDGLNLFHPDSGTFEVFKQPPDNREDYCNQIRSLFQDKKGNLWIGTTSGLFRFDLSKKEFSPVEFDQAINFQNLYNISFYPPGIKINSINEDPFGYLWIGTDMGLFKYDYGSSEFTISPPLHLKAIIEDIEMITLNSSHFAWIATHWGLIQYDFQTDNFTSFYTEPGDHESVSGQASHELFFDDRGLLWIATSETGIDILNLQKSLFHQYAIYSEPEDPNIYSASAFCEDNDGNFWIGSHAVGLLKYDQNLKLISRINLKFSDGSEWGGGRVKKILRDADGVMWLGFSNPKPSISWFNPENEIFQLITEDTIWPLLWEFPVRYMNDMIEDHRRNMWFGYFSGLYRMPGGENSDHLVRSVSHDELSSAIIRDLHEDSDYHVWLASDNGLFKAEPDMNDSLVFTKYFCSNTYQDNQPVKPRCVFQGTNGKIWVGTNQGLHQLKKGTTQYQSVNTENDLIRGNQINAITEDSKGDLWMATDKGLVKFNTNQDKNNIKLFERIDGLPYEGSISAPLFRSKSGKIFVPSKYGSQNGFYCFHPDSIIVNTNIPQVVITDFNVRNDPFDLDSNITSIKHIQLSHSENYFSFEFAALDYVNPEKNQYAYKLDGIDEEWINSGNRRFANYTSVPPGEYTFWVKGSNNDGYWNETGTSISVTILPPLWKTWWAYVIYALTVIAVLWSIVHYYLKRQRLLHTLAIEQVETDKLKELDTMKSRFFANISHEFRTPLTLILGPLQNLLSQSKDDKTKQDLSLIQRNASRLKNLINQLLSLSKLESGKMKLQAREENIVALVNGYVQSFESLAKQKKIDLVFKSDEKNIPVYVDKDKIEKILYNLLSNAFKFTGIGGRINVQVGTTPTADWSVKTADYEGPCVRIKISDTGHGIPPEKLPHVFDRFYQADDSYTKDDESSGIGLTLTKELVEIHHGDITVESKIGKGTNFCVILPKGKEHLKPEEIVSETIITVEREELQESVSKLEFIESDLITDDHLYQDEVDGKKDKPCILIVDDNADLRTYLRGYLDQLYLISEAQDGEKGFTNATEEIPDLIISDVMMPRMDGYELCKKLKTDERTSHIPVILLTARASKESRIEGLETGADDFIIKPFDGDELLVRIKNLLEQRKRIGSLIKERLQKSNLPGHFIIEDSGITSMDEQFLKRAFKTVKEHYSDSEFNVQEFSREMHMSRNQLHLKIRALTQQTPVDFIRMYRLNRAAGLIEKKSATIAEIAYDVGFSSPSYFSECFRKQFGVLPSEFSGTKR